MDFIVYAIAFVLILCVIVVVHEGGHALVARLVGMRVTEFFVGMPWGPALTFTSDRTGICYGATLALLGGYTRVAGMSYVPDERMAFALALVNARGILAPEELALVLACDVSQASMLLESLADLGSVERVYETDGRRRTGETPCDYATPDRDASGLTIRDKGNALRGCAPAHPASYPFDPGVTAEEFLESEISRTYKGASFLRRALVLVAGVAFNLLFAFVVLTGCYLATPLQGSYIGVSEVTQGGAAQAAGVVAGDAISAVGDTPLGEFSSIEEFNEAVAACSTATFVHVADDEGTQIVVEKVDGVLGVRLAYVESAAQYMTLPQAAGASLTYIGSVAASVLSLLVPSQAAQTLSQSTGVVGIATMTATAVCSGAVNVLVLLAVLSVSLAWMNLLPIAPLDGGKLVIEVVGRIIGREVPAWLQGLLSFLGIAAVLVLFCFMVVQDVSRLF